MRGSAYSDLGVEYVYTKATANKALSYEEDLHALLAQYTEDETTLQLFAATRLARLLPEKPTEPSAVERAALRYYVQALEKLSARIPPRAEPLYRVYRLAAVARDVELIVQRRLRGEQPPRDEELAYPEAPEVAAAKRLAEEEAEPHRILEAAGLAVAARLLRSAANLPLQVAVDAELLEAYRKALEAAGPLGKEIIGNRIDIHAARAAYTLAVAKPPREAVRAYLERLYTHRLPARQLAEAAETGDTEAIEKLLSEQLQRVPEEISLLDAFIASRRRLNRRLARRIFTEEPLSYDSIIGLYETLLLDSEDAVIIALAGYSRQPKRVVAELVSL